jgi:DNA-binding HxlR family transcriptional regulator
MALLDLLGRRGALRVLWELRGGPLTFRALQAAAALSPSVLNTRLAELRDAGIADHDAGGYALTPAGRALLAHLAPLHRWSEAWARREEVR